MLTGTLHKNEKEWIVKFPKHPSSSKVFEWKNAPLIPSDQDRIICSPESMEGREVEFELVDEFTHPQYYQNVGWGDGIKMAKITNI